MNATAFDTTTLEALEESTFPDLRGRVVSEIMSTPNREWAALRAEAQSVLDIQLADGEPHPGTILRCTIMIEMIEILTEEGFEGSYPADLPRDIAEQGANWRPAGGAKAANQYGVFKVRTLSVPQQRFIRNLIAEREVPEQLHRTTGGFLVGEWKALEMFRAGTANKKAASDLITWLLTLPVREEIAVEIERTGVKNPASDKQLHWIRTLPAEKVLASATPKVLATIQAVEAGDPVERKDASDALDFLFNAPKRPRDAAVDGPELASGIYRTDDGSIYKVYTNQAKNRMLAKILVIGAAGEKATWDYKGMASRFVKASQRMTLEQAKKFGAIYGVCCNCGALLTDETSIAEGIGPICAQRF